MYVPTYLQFKKLRVTITHTIYTHYMKSLNLLFVDVKLFMFVLPGIT